MFKLYCNLGKSYHPMAAMQGIGSDVTTVTIII